MRLLLGCDEEIKFQCPSCRGQSFAAAVPAGKYRAVGDLGGLECDRCKLRLRKEQFLRLFFLQYASSFYSYYRLED